MSRRRKTSWPSPKHWRMRQAGEQLGQGLWHRFRGVMASLWTFKASHIRDCFGANNYKKIYYRHSNLQNWMTTDNSDAFTYIGCHYVDLVHFITGLLPVSVSVYGVPDRFPNGNDGFLWTDARVIWNNGASLTVQNALGFPDEAPGTNTQGRRHFLRRNRIHACSRPRTVP